jgi:diaminopimelate decarboxylase
VVEPGRAIVGNAAILVTRVHAVEGRWVFLDASYNHLGESPLPFSRRILPVAQPGSSPKQTYHLSGCTLNTTDIIDVRRRLPPLGAGDVVALCDAGAYSISRASRYACLLPAAISSRETALCGPYEEPRPTRT